MVWLEPYPIRKFDHGEYTPARLFFFFALRYRRKTKNTKNHAKRTNGIQTTKLGIWKYEHFPISQCHPQDGNHDRTIPLC